MTSRRDFLKRTTLTTLAFAGLGRFSLHGAVQRRYSALVPDQAGLLDLPEGFSYQIISRTGERMNDGFIVPAGHDGMATFAGEAGRTILVRNHELGMAAPERGPFGAANALASRLGQSDFYDSAPTLGGTTTLVYDTKAKRLEEHHLSLTGTVGNCAGGPTPWGTWISCEESTQRADAEFRKDHGYNFEVVPAGRLAVPLPLKEMGRFNHEAVAVDPVSSIVYQTEDRANGLLYRFVPKQPRHLPSGGRLQALKIRDLSGVVTNNRPKRKIPIGVKFQVEWIDIKDVESPLDDLRLQGQASGAAVFDRGEGMWTGSDGIYFACTSGGAVSGGQVWRYVPSRNEGTTDESANPGTLQLFVEPDDLNVLEKVDNLTVTPWGDLFLCEDGPAVNRVVGVTPEGVLYDFARNALNESEVAGATFSPDGTTMFVNIQNPGLTLAITGPWFKGQS